MADPEPIAGRGEGQAEVGLAVVGKDPLDRDPVGLEEVPSPLEEGRRARRRLVAELLGIGQPGMVANRDVDLPPLRSGLSTDPGGCGRNRDRPTGLDAVGQETPTSGRETGVRMRH